MTGACAIEKVGTIAGFDAGAGHRGAGPGSARAQVHEGSIRWQLLDAGQGPCVLLLHGTGSSWTSWAQVAERIGGSLRVLAPDLPGNGRTDPLPRGEDGIAAYARSIATLLRERDARPGLIVGHSAGAAIAARLALDVQDGGAPAVLSVNGALRPLAGWTAATFLPVARLLALHPVVPSFVAALLKADRPAVRRLLASTGSRIDEAMVDRYEHLLRDSRHVAGTLRMMAHWDLRALARDLPRLASRLTLVVAGRDRTISPRDARWIAGRVPGCDTIHLPGLGHLAHEEAPTEFASIVRKVASARGLLPSPHRSLEPER